MLTPRNQRAIRRADTRNAIARQVRILKTFGIPGRDLDQPHRMAKHHALNCGKPHCSICANPRHSTAVKGRERLTRQELRALDLQLEGQQLLASSE